MKRKLLPIVIELVGISVTSVAIGVEIVMKADIGYVMMTTGGWLVAVGGIIWGKFMRTEH